MRSFGFCSTHKKVMTIVVLIGCFLLLRVSAFAQIGNAYDLSWRTIDAGGRISGGGPYTIKGTIGQPDAGVMNGNDYQLLGGFWPGEPLCKVDFYHFSLLAERWLEEPCNAGNSWCGGADLDQMGDVDLVDLRLFVDEWLDYCPYNWSLR